MTEDERKRHACERYLRAAHGVQTGVVFLIEKLMDPSKSGVSANHLRVGIDMQKADQAGLAHLLMEKGVFTELEYLEALASAAEAEQQRYEKEVNAQMGPGSDIKLR